MKRGFTSLMNRMDSAKKDFTLDDVTSDTMSIRSDLSDDDSDNFIMVAALKGDDPDSQESHNCLDAMFRFVIEINFKSSRKINENKLMGIFAL